jgi:hypothetical protein
MAEFEKALLGGNPSKFVTKRNPGEFFKTGPAIRDFIHNQVSTSRIIPDPNDFDKTSKLDINCGSKLS